MAEETAREVGPSGLDIVYERFGDPRMPPVLLIMGGGAQMINWPDGFCVELADRGLFVIRFDSRDAGRSTHLSDAVAVDIYAAMAGDLSTAAYNLSDMAADTVGLLDALGLGSAHLVGMSMGGMIAQLVAVEYPDRVRTLTSISSTTGDRAVGQADPGVLGSLGPQPTDRAGYIEWQVRASRALGSPGFEFDEQAVAARAALSYDRGHDPEAMMRHFVAVLASGDRTAQLKTVRIPTLVVHGTADPMCDVSGGRATAAAIPGAELVTFDGMGHNLPRELWSTLADHIAAHTAGTGHDSGSGTPVPDGSITA
ncbi:alpha/beta fold hydrolase [Nocardia altamirensis]|uniref:alpha/beta fold hydrolase n=1 Tax=Nocardia altamirensis TaxID=472158 RepID=UPI0008407C3C|nr:alpha/beta hydrolase [Nocardia altamirensis]